VDLPVLELLGQPVQLVLEDVGEALQRDEREDVVLELGGIERTADLAGGIPEPGLERGDIEHGDRPEKGVPHSRPRHSGLSYVTHLALRLSPVLLPGR
jgi:hypothetical protein